MNDLQKFFPNNNLQTLADDFAITTWDDFVRRFLMGEGKSPNTYKSYLTSCQQFYDFTGGLHPMQAGTPEWIESWYDSLTGDLNTKALRICGLKFLYKKICERYPFYVNPFSTMNEKLTHKLGRSKKDESLRDSLTRREYTALLNYLRIDKSIRGVQDYAIVRWGITSGQRAAELIGLTWGQIVKAEAGGYSVTFTGKGSKVRTIYVDDGAVTAIRAAFRARWGRAPQVDDKVFCSLSTGSMTNATLGNRIRDISEAAKAAGILRANLLITPHVMRHTSATLDLEAGVPLDALQRKLGHSSLATTQRYLHSKVDWSEIYEARHTA